MIGFFVTVLSTRATLNNFILQKSVYPELLVLLIAPLPDGVNLFFGYSSSAKFESGTGWPSFNAAIETISSNDASSLQLSVAEKTDYSYGMVRTEVLCRQVKSRFPSL